MLEARMRLRTAVLLGLFVSAPALALEDYVSPTWTITIDDYGYSDFLVYTAGPFPKDYLHEMISGEWAAAIGYDGIPLTLPIRTMWVEPEFIYPDWTTNSNFLVTTFQGTPGDTDGDGLPEGFSVVANNEVEIRIDNKFIDTVTGVPMGVGTGFVLSDRYVLRVTYTIKNLKATPLTGVRFYPFLHGHPANDERNSVRVTYDTTAYSGTLATWRYDVTHVSTNTGATDGTPTGCTLTDHIGFSMDVAPADFGLGSYRGHIGRPAAGLHDDVERDVLGNQTSFGPDETAGAMRRDLGTLAAGASASVQVLLTVRSEDQSPNGSSADVCIRVQPASPEPRLFVDRGPCGPSSSSPNPWDIVAGSLGNLEEFGGTVNIGTTACLANNLTVDRVTDHSRVSDCRRGVFFLARSATFGNFYYGSASSGSQRFGSQGDCSPF
jgi:hypothetical protein